MEAIIQGIADSVASPAASQRNFLDILEPRSVELVQQPMRPRCPVHKVGERLSDAIVHSRRICEECVVVIVYSFGDEVGEDVGVLPERVEL